MSKLTAAASAQSWVAIWLGTMDARFHAHSQPNSQGKEGPVTYKKVMNKDNTGEKLAKSMHQNSCGYGFTWRERGYVNPTVYQFKGHSESNMLGASPRECKTIGERWRMKNGWNR